MFRAGPMSEDPGASRELRGDRGRGGRESSALGDLGCDASGRQGTGSRKEMGGEGYFCGGWCVYLRGHDRKVSKTCGKDPPSDGRFLKLQGKTGLGRAAHGGVRAGQACWMVGLCLGQEGKAASFLKPLFYGE